MRLEFIAGYGTLLGYFALCAAGALALRRLVAVPAEVFRKTLHVILLGSILILTYVFHTWWVSALASAVFIAMVFPILAFAERLPGYSRLLTERRPGEIRRSLVAVFGMFAALLCVCWGWLGERYLVVASVFAWGFGDAAAALVGKRFGQHAIEGRLVEGRISLEGTLAMFAVSFVTVMVILLANGALTWYGCIPAALVTAALCAVVELFTKGGIDTLTCPLTAAAVLIPLVHFWGA